MSLYENFISFLKENNVKPEVGSTVCCPQCGHSWQVRKEDKRPLFCHSCGWDDSIKDYDIKGLRSWQEKYGFI
jgi:hypothetical protein